MMKKIAVGIGILLLLLLVAAVLAPFLVDLNKHKPALLVQLKPHVSREVDFRNIELTILTGLGAEIEGLRIADNPAFSKEDFLRLESLRVRIRLLPLLRKRIEVKSVVIGEPAVSIVRDPKGVFNFQDLLVTEPEVPGGESQAPPAEKKAAPALGALAGFLVSELEVREGTVLFRDEQSRPGAEPVLVERLNLKVEDVSLVDPVRIRLSASLLEGDRENFELEGRAGPLGEALHLGKVPFSFRVFLKEVPATSVVSLVPKELPLGVTAGRLSLKLGADGSAEEGISVEAEMHVGDLVLEESGGKGSKTGKLDGKLLSRMRVSVSSQQVALESLSLELNGNRVILEGSLEGVLKEPKWDVKARTEELRPGALLALFPMYARHVPEDFRWEGPLAVTAQSSGTLDDLKTQGTASLDGMKINYGQTFNKPAGVPFVVAWEGEKKAAKLTVKKVGVKLHQLDATATGEIVLDGPARLGLLVQTNSIPLKGWDAVLPALSGYGLEGDLYARSSIKGTVENLSANLQAGMDRIVFSLPGSGSPKEGSGPIPGRLEGVSLEAQGKRREGVLAGTGDLKVKVGEVRSIRFEKVLGRFDYRPDRVEIAGLEMQLFEGRIRSTGRVDLSNKSWSFRPVVEEVSVGPVLDHLTRYKGMFSGRFSGEFSAEGTAAPEGQKAPIAARGEFRLSQGTVENFDLVGSVLETLFGLQGVSQTLGKGQGEVAKHGKTRFDHLDCKFDMKDEVIELTTRLRNAHTSRFTDSDAVLDGRVALAEQQLDMKGKVILSKKHSGELARDVEVLKALLDAEQRMVLPISLKGSISKPTALLDTQYVLGAMAKHYGRQGLEKLGEQLGLPKQQEGQKPVEKLLKDLLGQ